MEEQKYYYIDNDIQIGPLTFTELKLSGIKKDTMVWFNGMADWAQAGTVAELNPIFKNLSPPPFIKKDISKPVSQTDLYSQIACQVWKSRIRRESSIVFKFIGWFLIPIGILLLLAGSTEEKGIAIFIVLFGLFLLIIGILIKSTGKEIFRLSVDKSTNLLKVERAGNKKNFQEDWANRIKKFEIMKTVHRSGKGTYALFELKVWLTGSEYSWPVPGSVFYSKKDAENVLSQANKLLCSVC